YRNTDAAGKGQWEQVFTESGFADASIAIAPSNQNIVYVLADDNGGALLSGLHAVLRSASSGDLGTWTAQVRGETATGINRYLLSDSYYAFMSTCRKADS